MTNFVFRRGRFFSGKLRMPWETGAPKVIALETTDRREARRALDEIVKERFMEHRGELTPRAIREASERPLNELLEAFLMARRANGKKETTLAKYRSNVATVAASCGWRLLKDVTRSSFLKWWAQMDGGPKSRNDKRANLLGFIRWLVGEKLLSNDPLEGTQRDTRAIDRFRRALSEEEQRRFLQAAPPFRRVVYLLILETGARRNELNLLRVGDLVLDTPAPFVRLPASITKNKREACMRLRPHVVAAVRSVLPDHALSSAWLLHNRVPRTSTVRRDLRRAGIAIENEHGRVDLHALRVTFCTNLLNAGVHPRVAQELMRHSDIKLTMKNYTDPSQLPVAAALEKLPIFGAISTVEKCIQKRAHGAHSAGQDGAQPVTTGLTGDKLAIVGGEPI